MLQQGQTQASALVFRLDGDVEQMRLVKNDLHHPVAHLLLAFEHQPDLILAQAIEKNPAGPGMAVGRIFDLQNSFRSASVIGRNDTASLIRFFPTRHQPTHGLPHGGLALWLFH